jgi:hypothetical protein
MARRPLTSLCLLYNKPMTTSKTYRPELLPRKGEFTAWALALAAALGMIFLTLRGQIPSGMWFVIIFLFFSAIIISLGNWMDRHTLIRLNADGVAFENGPRKVHLTWVEIKEVRTFPASWSTAVQVLGERAHFRFNTLGELQFRGEVRGRMGFAQGKEILDEIIRASGLIAVSQAGQVTRFSR